MISSHFILKVSLVSRQRAKRRLTRYAAFIAEFRELAMHVIGLDIGWRVRKPVHAMIRPGMLVRASRPSLRVGMPVRMAPVYAKPTNWDVVPEQNKIALVGFIRDRYYDFQDDSPEHGVVDLNRNIRSCPRFVSATLPIVNPLDRQRPLAFQ
jgi:hypothetical protein